jgi:hypothetical protein
MRFIGANMAYLRIIMRSFMSVLMVLTLGRASAQSDTIFPNVDGSWEMTTITWDWDSQNDYFHYGLRYFAQPSVEMDSLSWGIVTDYDFVPVGLIAVNQNKVYFKSTQPFSYGYGVYYDTTARVLYDFGLSVNDTAYWRNGSEPIIVQSIDTVWLAGRARKRLHVGTDDWVAGIGSMNGLLVPFQYYFEVAYTLDYFCGNYLSADSVAYQACLPLSTGIPRPVNDRSSIYPNPSKGSFFINGPAPGLPYRLTDARGMEVLAGKTTGPNTVVQMPDAVPGLYVLDLAGAHIKVIVQ